MNVSPFENRVPLGSMYTLPSVGHEQKQLLMSKIILNSPTVCAGICLQCVCITLVLALLLILTPTIFILCLCRATINQLGQKYGLSIVLPL